MIFKEDNMKYKLVTMSRLIEKTSFLEDLKEFDITKKEVTMKGYLGKDWTYNEFYIDIKTIEQLEKIQKITECPISLYRGTLEIEDCVCSCIGGNIKRGNNGK